MEDVELYKLLDEVKPYGISKADLYNLGFVDLGECKTSKILTYRFDKNYPLTRKWLRDKTNDISDFPNFVGGILKPCYFNPVVLLYCNEKKEKMIKSGFVEEWTESLTRHLSVKLKKNFGCLFKGEGDYSDIFALSKYYYMFDTYLFDKIWDYIVNKSHELKIPIMNALIKRILPLSKQTRLLKVMFSLGYRVEDGYSSPEDYLEKVREDFKNFSRSNIYLPNYTYEMLVSEMREYNLFTYSKLCSFYLGDNASKSQNRRLNRRLNALGFYLELERLIYWKELEPKFSLNDMVKILDISKETFTRYGIHVKEISSKNIFHDITDFLLDGVWSIDDITSVLGIEKDSFNRALHRQGFIYYRSLGRIYRSMCKESLVKCIVEDKEFTYKEFNNWINKYGIEVKYTEYSEYYYSLASTIDLLKRGIFYNDLLKEIIYVEYNRIKGKEVNL